MRFFVEQLEQFWLHFMPTSSHTDWFEQKPIETKYTHHGKLQ